MKKYIAFLLCIIFIVSGSAVYSAGAEENHALSNNDYEILTSLGIINGYEDGAFRLEESVTRAEFAMLMVMLQGMDGFETKPDAAMFYDVPVSYWASGYIKLASELGLMNGTSATTFEPDGYVTLEQASKVLVKIMGYGQLAEVSGGYPFGYLGIASKHKITDGVSTGVLTRADVLRLMMNTLEAECLEEASYSADSASYREGKTLFEKYHGIKMVEGQLISTGDASIYGEPVCDEYFVNIDGINYNANGANYFSLLAQKVECYVDDDNKVLYMHSSGESEVTVVNAEDVISGETQIGKNGTVKLAYYNDKRKETVSLPAETGYIINNRPYKPPFVLGNLVFADGQIKLIDGDFDGEVETVIIDKYEVIIAKGVSSYEGFITDELRGNNLNDLNSLDKTVKVIRNGKDIKYGEIASGNTLLVKVSQDGEYIEIIVSDQTVSGTLNEYNDSADEIVIDGTTYKLHPDFDRATLKLGVLRTYCIDAMGRIVWIDESGTKNSGYCYLFGAKLSNMNAHLDIKVLEADGQIHELSTNGGKVKYNDKITKVENVCAALCDAEGKTVEQVIAIKKTEDGFVDSIKAGSEISLDYPAAARSYSTGQKLFGAFEPDGFGITDSTPVFVIYDDPDDCKVMPISMLQDRTEYNTVEGYNGAETFVCEAVVIRPQSGSDSVPFDYSTPFGVVIDSFETIDSEGDEVKGFKIFVNGVTVSLKLTDKAFATKIKLPEDFQTPIPLSDIKPGDVVQYNLTMNGDIENIGRLFPYETNGNPATESEFTAGHGWSRERTFGTVWKIAGDYMRLKVNSEYYTFMIRNAPITVYDYEEEECREGSVGDLIDYETDPERASKVFIRANYGKIDGFIVFKNIQG